MVVSKLDSEIYSAIEQLTTSQKRRIRRKRLQAARACDNYQQNKEIEVKEHTNDILPIVVDRNPLSVIDQIGNELKESIELGSRIENLTMSSKEPSKSREEVLAAREAKKRSKLKAKKGDTVQTEGIGTKPVKGTVKKDVPKQGTDEIKNASIEKSSKLTNTVIKGEDEVDHLVDSNTSTNVVSVHKEIIDKGDISNEKSKEKVIAERAAKKAMKQAKKKGLASDGVEVVSKEKELEIKHSLKGDNLPNNDMTMKDVVETLKDILNVAKEVQGVTAKVQAINLEPKRQEEPTKSKAELKAERRAKQEAQRAAKQAANVVKQKDVSSKPVKIDKEVVKVKEDKPKTKLSDKTKSKPQYTQRINWFQHLSTEHDKESLKNIAINSNLHPAIVKLGVQLASRVVAGSNARCIALLDALKKMVTDYTLPAKTEFARGLESHLSASLDYLWSMRQPSASQTNAIKYFRHNLTQLENNINEHDAKKILLDLIDNYVKEQIDKAGEAISLAVREKISEGDNILTYGCSSLVERILVEAWAARVRFHVVVVGSRLQRSARGLLQRLCAAGLPCTYLDITAVSHVIKKIDKVVVGAGSLLVNGSVLGAAGTAQVALLARAANVPVLVAAETHKFSDRVQTDAFVYNEIGDPDELIDKSDENSPLKDWRSNPNLTPLNLLYDVTPPSLVTAVVTDLAILPCTSAPVVLRTKLAEHGV
ncbi:translation initiation factor eIF-2B subunit delta isoform X1 [Achroia grisella]|uniref:translation initiation factor eIF-2B subunit delta isoform X1 n=1 Tax=Achroia grisella TaxID=688607 RepID=UPI0027D24611|nr:translation initiation factor eIF-2B subunit delta isoform X1 [Achroia grisella]